MLVRGIGRSVLSLFAPSRTRALYMYGAKKQPQHESGDERKKDHKEQKHPEKQLKDDHEDKVSEIAGNPEKQPLSKQQLQTLKKQYVSRYEKLSQASKHHEERMKSLQQETQLEKYEGSAGRSILSKFSFFKKQLTQNKQITLENQKLQKEIQESRMELEKKINDADVIWKKTKNNIEKIKLDASAQFGKQLIEFERKMSSLPSVATSDTPQDIVTGVQMIRKILIKVLSKNGMTTIENVNEKFDKELHEKAGQVEGKEKNMVSEVKQKGWKIHDKVHKPAKVIVTK